MTKEEYKKGTKKYELDTKSKQKLDWVCPKMFKNAKFTEIGKVENYLFN